MITQISYNVLIERFKAFAEGHFLIKGFTHGHPSNIDIEKGLTFPWMHVFPVEVEPRQGTRLYTFIITFADLPRDKETPAEYEREVISDCIKLAEDLIAEIQNGLTLFGPTVELEGSPSIEVFIQEYSQTLTGVNLALTLSVPWDWSACDIPADWSVGGSGSGGTGAGGTGVILETNGVLNGDQTLLNLQQGENITIVDNGFGEITISSTGGGGDDVATEFNVNHTTDTGNQYVIGDRVWYLGNVYQCIANNDALVPTNALYWSLVGAGFRLRQSPVDWNATSGDFQILNKPTIPAAQVNSDWNASSGVAEILNKPTIPAAQIQSDWTQANNAALDFIKNKPTIPAAQVNSDWNAVSGLAQILNKPFIPVNIDDLADVSAAAPANFNSLYYLNGVWKSGFIALDWLQDVNAPTPTNGQVLTFDSATGVWIAATPAAGGVTSVGLTMPSAFSVAGSPITSAGTLAVSAAGLATQYVRGDGQLANFPTTGGGGSSVSYYLNGSINQGTIGGSTYYQMSKTAIFGAGTDFTRTNAQGNGLIAQFITDANDPNVLLIPGGNFNLELYFSASSSGGSPSFYVELYKYDGTTFTLLATDVASPEGITQGTTIDTYFTALSVPPTTMALTDRFALRVFVTTSGRTLKLHTENSHLSQVITTLSTGVNAINGLTAQVQNLAVGTAGTDFAISSVGSTHTFNIPTASAANRGLLSTTDWLAFNAKADLASPAFTGTPTAPTAISGTNTTQIATTAFVQNMAIQSASLIAIFGDGGNGAATITGPLSLGEDTYYTDLTVSGAGSINLNGYRLFVSGTLNLSNAGANAIYNNGLTGNSGTVGAQAGVRGGLGVTVSGYGAGNTGIALSGAGGAGGVANTNNATAGAAPTTIAAATRHNAGGPGGAGGLGGASLFTGAVGGAGQATLTSPSAFYLRTLNYGTTNSFIQRAIINQGAIPFQYLTVDTVGGRHGGGGGGGSSSAVANGKSGGSGGSGGGIVFIYARQIIVGASTNAGAISARGGNGGNGGTSNFFGQAGGGGGGGGGGGYVYLVYGTITGGSYTFVTADGGVGGAGSIGNPPAPSGTTGIGGTGGTGGNGGRITAISLGSNTITQVDGTGSAAATPTTATTQAGTPGTSGGICTFSS